MQPEKLRRRSSILKPPKARNPLSDLDAEQNDAENDGTTFDKNKRVSFSSKKGVALFTMTDHGNTIWHNFYEEPNKPDVSETSDVAESLIQKLEASINQQRVSQGEQNAAEDMEDDDRCVNISAMINSLTKINSENVPDASCFNITNPFLSDRTEALINFQIKKDAPFNLTDGENKLEKLVTKQSPKSDVCDDSDMSITQTISIPVQIMTNESTKQKPIVANTFVYPDVRDKKETWMHDKENIQIPMYTKEFNDVENDMNAYNDRYARNDIQQDYENSSNENSIASTRNVMQKSCDLSITSALSQMINDICRM
ncbi:uncharacterized protein LOC143922587 [Arctopsyche grandis]|uniref:uncharacterized protein LOC143922508 n=1 Tax=Arctopsyche grandis TaxID=121162 RepID=UPI00406D6406